MNRFSTQTWVSLLSQYTAVLILVNMKVKLSRYYMCTFAINQINELTQECPENAKLHCTVGFLQLDVCSQYRLYLHKYAC